MSLLLVKGLFEQVPVVDINASLEHWLVPIWVIAMGVLIGLAASAAVYGVILAISRNWGKAIDDLVVQGLLQPFFYTCLVPAALAVLMFIWAPYRQVFGQIQFSGSGALLALGRDADLMLTIACTVLDLFLVAVVLRIALPKVSAVAVTTAKEGMGQPLFWVIVGVGVFLLVVFIWVPYNTFGEDIKMLKTQGLELLMVAAIFLAVATASVSVSQEIEGRTAMTVLSKPIARWEFIVGKFLGVVAPVLLMFFVLGFVFLCTVSYKVVYDGAEGGQVVRSAEACLIAVRQVVPGLTLRFIEAAIFAAISVTIATRLQMLANLSICMTVYAVGHLVPLMVQKTEGSLETVKFVGQLISTVIPVLAWFDVQAGIVGDRDNWWEYVGHSALYGLFYCTFMLLLALVLFEDRDLA